MNIFNRLWKRKWDLSKRDKTLYTLILSIIFIITFVPFLAKFIPGFIVNITRFNTDKKIYFIDDEMIINATWDLNYNPQTEYSYVQIHLYDVSGNLYWKSQIYQEIGTFFKNWTIPIKKLDLVLLNTSNYLYVKMFYFYLEFSTMQRSESFLDTISVEIFKKDISCNLINFRENITFNETLNFKAKFFYNSTNLINEQISFIIKSEGMIIYNSSFITNINGEIDITITDKMLNLGLNLLIFEVINNEIYNKALFYFNITLGKIKIYSHIERYDDILNPGTSLHLKIHYYYQFNDSKYNLNFYPINIQIYDNYSLLFSNNFYTNENGTLDVEISQREFSNNEGDIYVHIISQNSSQYQSNILILQVKIVNNESILQKNNSLPVILLIVILFVIIFTFALIIWIFHKKKPKSFSETFSS